MPTINRHGRGWPRFSLAVQAASSDQAHRIYARRQGRVDSHDARGPEWEGARRRPPRQGAARRRRFTERSEHSGERTRVTDATHEALAHRRFARQALDDGFEPISENGSPLWRFHRGAWINRQIVEARVAPGGVEAWIKHAPRPSPQTQRQSQALAGSRP